MVKSKPSMTAQSMAEPSYSTHEPRRVDLPFGDTAVSYGEGWENGYHVYLTDKQGGKYVDKGSVGVFEIGDEIVVDRPYRAERPGVIMFAHIYPDGSYDFNVETADSYTSRFQVDPRHMRKRG